MTGNRPGDGRGQGNDPLSHARAGPGDRFHSAPHGDARHYPGRRPSRVRDCGGRAGAPPDSRLGLARAHRTLAARTIHFRGQFH